MFTQINNLTVRIVGAITEVKPYKYSMCDMCEISEETNKKCREIFMNADERD